MDMVFFVLTVQCKITVKLTESWWVKKSNYFVYLVLQAV